MLLSRLSLASRGTFLSVEHLPCCRSPETPAQPLGLARSHGSGAVCVWDGRETPAAAPAPAIPGCLPQLLVFSGAGSALHTPELPAAKGSSVLPAGVINQQRLIVRTAFFSSFSRASWRWSSAVLPGALHHPCVCISK